MEVFEVGILIFDLKTLYKEVLKEKFGNAVGKELVRALFKLVTLQQEYSQFSGVSDS